LPPFQGGAAGYFGYDLGRQTERLPATARDDSGLPEMLVGLYDWVIAWDHAAGRVWLCATGLPDGTAAAARARTAMVLRLLDTTEPYGDAALARPVLRSNFRRTDYLRAVERALAYIRAGDIYQVNLSQRFRGAWAGDPQALYRRVRAVSPVPYGAYLDFGDVQVVSASPECFLRFDGSRVETYPIKGTRPRGATPAEDERLAAGLLASEKDRAENVMIVDLLRNDLGKVCRIGSVDVPRLFAIEGYSHVWQMVSTVTGLLRPELDAVDLLRACFPGGSVTGCPKIRAMAIIEELEGVRRGVYCGAIGCIGFSGVMTTSIVIRTLVLHRGRLDLQVGGAIVADSDPQGEYEETLAKAAALVAALEATLEDAAS
jgi:para-aminobenzoate synthetase component 1